MPSDPNATDPEGAERGALYVVATPIGNLEDITLRALRILKEVTVIMAEDTRTSRRLLDHYGITTHMRAFHAHNEHAVTERIVDELARCAENAEAMQAEDLEPKLQEALETRVVSERAMAAARDALEMQWRGRRHLPQREAGERLRPVTDATSVRVRNGKSEVLNGPYADTQEQLGGYYVIDVPDLDAALVWAARCPSSVYGTIEVRPIWEM